MTDLFSQFGNVFRTWAEQRFSQPYLEAVVKIHLWNRADLGWDNLSLLSRWANLNGHEIVSVNSRNFPQGEMVLIHVADLAGLFEPWFKRNGPRMLVLCVPADNVTYLNWSFYHVSQRIASLIPEGRWEELETALCPRQLTIVSDIMMANAWEEYDMSLEEVIALKANINKNVKECLACRVQAEGLIGLISSS